jgi:xanthine dehydrogenase small subunit
MSPNQCNPSEPEPSSITFLLNGERQIAPASLARTTLLAYLRDVAGLKGAKEGCGEGGCGACTVALHDRAAGRYRAVYACITLLGMVNERSIVTIEGLNPPVDGRRCEPALHPVSRALLDSAAAQCGFCTPSVAVTLFCLFSLDDSPSDDEIHGALASNLCRCTGYGPIIHAARGLRDASYRASYGGSCAAESSKAAVAADFFTPRSLEELDRCVGRIPDTQFLGGGTQVLPRLLRNTGIDAPFVYLGNVRELRRIEHTRDYIEIGAAVPLVSAMATIVAEHASLVEVFRRLASVTVNNVATLAGNLAGDYRAGDLAPILIALGATALLRNRGRHRSVPIEDWHAKETALAAGELIEAIRIPKSVAGQQVRAYKVAKRFEQAATIVLGAFSLAFDGERIVSARVCYLGLGGPPRRARRVELALAGGRFDETTLARACDAVDEELDPVPDSGSTVAYRRAIARNLLAKLRLDLSGRESVSLWGLDK